MSVRETVGHLRKRDEARVWEAKDFYCFFALLAPAKRQRILLFGGNGVLNPKMWTKIYDPYFDPYGFISDWTERISVDFEIPRTPLSWEKAP